MVLKKCFGNFLFVIVKTVPIIYLQRFSLKLKCVFFVKNTFSLVNLICSDNYVKKVFIPNKIIQERIWFSNKNKLKSKGSPKRLKETKIYYIILYTQYYIYIECILCAYENTSISR